MSPKGGVGGNGASFRVEKGFVREGGKKKKKKNCSGVKMAVSVKIQKKKLKKHSLGGNPQTSKKHQKPEILKKEM